MFSSMAAAFIQGVYGKAVLSNALPDGFEIVLGQREMVLEARGSAGHAAMWRYGLLKAT